jgi:hypothetical protein
MTNTFIMNRLRARSAGAIRSGGTGGGGLPYLVSSDYATITDGMNAAVAAGKRLYIVPGVYTGALTLIEGADLFGDGPDYCWLNGWVKTAPHYELTDLKVGIEGGTNGTNAFGRTATHSFRCTRVTFTGGPVSGYTCGVIAYSDVDCYDGEFNDCIIEGDPTNYVREGASFTNYGKATGLMHDVRFDGCTFKSGGGCGANVIGYHNTGGPAYDHPIQRFDFIDCVFEPMGAQGVSTACWWPQRDGDGAGIYTNGYMTFDGCTFQDCGAYADTDQGKHCIELYGMVHQTVKNCHCYGPNIHSFLSIEQYGNRNTVGALNSQNVIEDNNFDGTLSATSSIALGSSYVTFRRNTVRVASHATVKNGSNYTIEGNHFYSVGGADYIFYAQNTDAYQWTDNDFHSAYTYGMGKLDSLSGDPSTNHVFGTDGHGNTYDYTGGGSKWVRRVTGSSCSGADVTADPTKFE